MVILTSALQATGLLLLVAGFALLAPWLAFVVAGVLLFVVGYLLEGGEVNVPESDRA